MKALVLLAVILVPTLAPAQDAVWRNHSRVSCVSLFRQECIAGTSACTRTNSDARWEIDFARKSIRYVNANFSERIVALRDDSRGLSEAVLLDSGRLLRIHRHDEDGAKFEASMLETNTGDTFAFTRFRCRATNGREFPNVR
ncbi:hypothetical protein [Caulobacter sp.]|uniref:hypothetical protein n=1 Tax=Caulobacter sp. TaxID=78 RepID=UPI002B4A2566|nr:hypothetical protein [Caulobacter sp.]HJV43143.1 hypothetical protein [Caulobacter sp.]